MENAKWITCDGDIQTPVIERGFVVQSPISGKIKISGLGFFELRINGKKVSDDILSPVLSDYHKRELCNLTYPIKDTFSHRVYYMSYVL